MIENLIYDIGMNNGDDSAYYLYLGYKVVAIDASPALAEEAERRFEDFIRDDKIQIINLGIPAEEGHLDFDVNKYHSA